MNNFEIGEYEKRMLGAIDNLTNNFSGLRSGRASVSLVDSLIVEIKSPTKGSIYYSVNQSSPSLYKNPIILYDDAKIECRVLQSGQESKNIITEYFKIDGGRSITLHSDYANQYSAAGQKTLIDHLK